MEPEPLVVAVPKMLIKRISKLPQGLYVVNLDGGVRLLIAETAAGYVGIPWRCPHKAAMFMTAGMVNSGEETIFCQAHGITYSLASGEAVENLAVDGQDPGMLKMYKVERDGDLFIIRSSAEASGFSSSAEWRGVGRIE